MWTWQQDASVRTSAHISRVQIHTRTSMHSLGCSTVWGGGDGGGKLQSMHILPAAGFRISQSGGLEPPQEQRVYADRQSGKARENADGWSSFIFGRAFSTPAY